MTPRRRGPAVSPSVKLSAAVATALAGLVGCVQNPMPFDPRLAQQWERRDNAAIRTEPLKVLPTTQQSPFVSGATTRANVGQVTYNAPTGPMVKMALREIVHRAVANNLDIRVAGFDTAIDQTRVLEAEANFDPQFFTDINFERVAKQTGGSNAFGLAPGVDPETNRSIINNQSVFQQFVARVDREALTTFDIGFRQNLSSGGRVEVKQTVTNQWYFPVRQLYNPYFQNDLVLTLQQPLLQNFGVAVNQARITIARNTQRVSLLDFRKTTEDTVLRIEQTYWQLVQTQRDVDTARRLVQVSEATTSLLFEQQRRGQNVAAAQINQANAQTDARRVDLIALQAQLGILSNQLKTLMNDPAYPVSGAVQITPADDFLNDPLHFDVDDMVETALENRLELGQQQVRVDSAEIAVDVARNGLLPSLTANISADVNGVSRTFNDVFRREGQFNNVGFATGLQFQLPIGNRVARAVWQRALLQRMQAIAGYGSLVEKVTGDVKNAAIGVDNAWKRLYASHNAVLNYHKLLDNLEASVRSGNQALNQEFVFLLLQDQEQLAGQERAEHLAQNDYNYAIAQLEGAKGTILRYDHVMLEQEQLPFDLQLPGEPDPRPTPPGYPYPDRVIGPLGR